MIQSLNKTINRHVIKDWNQGIKLSSGYHQKHLKVLAQSDQGIILKTILKFLLHTAYFLMASKGKEIGWLHPVSHAASHIVWLYKTQGQNISVICYAVICYASILQQTPATLNNSRSQQQQTQHFTQQVILWRKSGVLFYHTAYSGYFSSSPEENATMPPSVRLRQQQQQQAHSLVTVLSGPTSTQKLACFTTHQSLLINTWVCVLFTTGTHELQKNKATLKKFSTDCSKSDKSSCF